MIVLNQFGGSLRVLTGKDIEINPKGLFPPREGIDP